MAFSFYGRNSGKKMVGFIVGFFSKNLCGLLLAATLAGACQKPSGESSSNTDPYSQWNEAQYAIARSASNANYLLAIEKDIFYYINLARLNPTLFANTYVKDYEGSAIVSKGFQWEQRKISLIAQLKGMAQQAIVSPSLPLFNEAKCFAEQAGSKGLVGHSRSGTTCTSHFDAESIAYGGDKTALYIVMELLIDSGEGNEALLHRKMLLAGALTQLGTAVRDHSVYQTMAVLDFQ